MSEGKEQERDVIKKEDNNLAQSLATGRADLVW